MRKPITMKQLLAALQKRRAKAQGYADSFKGSTNPQVIELLNQSRGEVSALDEVIGAIERRSVYDLEH